MAHLLPVGQRDLHSLDPSCPCRVVMGVLSGEEAPVYVHFERSLS